MKSTHPTDVILTRLAEIEPAARALEESPADRKALTARVLSFADRLLDDLSARRVWSTEPGALG